MVDINLRKELTVDGAPIERLPTSPSLMIVESGHDTSSLEKVGKKERKKEEGSLLASLLSGMYLLHILHPSNAIYFLLTWICFIQG